MRSDPQTYKSLYLVLVVTCGEFPNPKSEQKILVEAPRKMDYVAFVIAVSSLWIVLNLVSLYRHRHKKTGMLPPGPRPYPVIGNILDLGDKPHQSLAHLSKTYGPIMSLKLGSITTIVFTSPQTAQQILQKNDQKFWIRPTIDAGRASDHHHVSMTWTLSASKFRNLRKFCNSQLFTVPRLDAGQDFRRKKVQELLDYVQESALNSTPVDINRAVFTTSLNLLSNTFFSIDLAKYTGSYSQEFKELVRVVMEETGRPNVGDFFPFVRLLDPQGVRRRTSKAFDHLLSIVDGFINERMQGRSTKNDVLDVMLGMIKEEGSELDRNDMKHLLVDLFVAGTDTTSTTVEWAMSELMRNASLMAKAQAEVREALDKAKPIQESDISALPYLQAIVKETLRLHPPAPLILPHQAESDIEMDGFLVPKNSRVLVNVWAIGRDPNVWSEPDVFMPERFLDKKIDVKGRDFELIPFGAGRRICPGLPLADRMVHLTLASLVQQFDWTLGDGNDPKELDMGEKFGMTLQKNESLQAVPIKVY